MTNVSPPTERKRWSTVEAAVAALAGRQHGVVSRRQLIELGLGPSAIEFAIGVGRLHILYRGAYAVGHRKIGIDGWRMAAVLTYGDDAALSNRAAAAHWNLRQSSAIEVTVPRTVRRRPGLLVHCLPLPPDEVTTHEGIPITTVPRTIFDLAPLGETVVTKAMAKADYLQLTDALTLAALVERYAHRKHAGVITKALSNYQPDRGVTANDFEDAFDDFLHSRGFPSPEKNAWVQLGTRWIKGDFVWRAQKVIVETDGATHRTVLGQRSDYARDRAAAAHDWRVVRVTPWALANEAGEIDADLKRALGL